MPLQKYTIEMVTDASQEDVIAAISLLGSTNDLRIKRELLINGKSKPDLTPPDPRILFHTPTQHRPKGAIDVIGSLKKLGLTIDELFERPYKQGTAEYMIKRSVMNNRRYHDQDIAR